MGTPVVAHGQSKFFPQIGKLAQSHFSVGGLYWSQVHRTAPRGPFKTGLSLVPTTDSRFWLDDTNLADANDRQPQHHNIGTPLLNTDEGDTDGQPRWEGTHTEDNVESEYSDVPESVAGEAVNSEEEEPTLVEDVAPSRAWMDSLRSLDVVNVSALIRCRAIVMKSPPRFFRGTFRTVLRFALQEANAAVAAPDERRQCRAWKLFLLAPRMLSFRETRGGSIPKNQLQERFGRFTRGDWVGLRHWCPGVGVTGRALILSSAGRSVRRRWWHLGKHLPAGQHWKEIQSHLAIRPL